MAKCCFAVCGGQNELIVCAARGVDDTAIELGVRRGVNELCGARVEHTRESEVGIGVDRRLEVRSGGLKGDVLGVAHSRAEVRGGGGIGRTELERSVCLRSRGERNDGQNCGGRDEASGTRTHWPSWGGIWRRPIRSAGARLSSYARREHARADVNLTVPVSVRFLHSPPK